MAYCTSIRRAGGGGTFGSVTVSTPSVRSADTLSLSIRVGELERPRERAMAALDLVEMYGTSVGDASIDALAADRQPRVLHRELDRSRARPGTSAVTT